MCSAAAHWHLSCPGRNLKSAQVELHLEQDPYPDMYATCLLLQLLQLQGLIPLIPYHGCRVFRQWLLSVLLPFFFSEGERVCLAAGGNFRAAGSVGLIKIKPSF